MFLDAVSLHPIEEQDGILNYFITKTLRQDTMTVSLLEQIMLTFYEFYNKPSYFNYERAIGLILAIRLEGIRRRWDGSGATARILMIVIEDIYNHSIGTYEDKKMLENGDI